MFSGQPDRIRTVTPLDSKRYSKTTPCEAPDSIFDLYSDR